MSKDEPKVHHNRYVAHVRKAAARVAQTNADAQAAVHSGYVPRDESARKR